MDITEHFLQSLYNDLQTEVSSKMNSLKNLNESDKERETDLSKEIQLLNTISMSVIKLKNHRLRVAKK